MKLVVFSALVAFVVAGPLQNGPVVISTPDKLVVLSHADSQKKTDLLEHNSWEQYRQQYLPVKGQRYPTQYEKQYLPYQGQQFWQQGNHIEIPQYIVYELHQAEQNGYTPVQLQAYFVKQGFPQFIAEYFTEQYEAFTTQSWGKSPYLAFQHYYELSIPQQVQQWVSQQISQAYEHYQQYFTKNGQYVWQQEFTYPQSVGQYVTEQARYLEQNGWSYQYAFQELQQSLKYAQNAIQYLEGGKFPQEFYEYVFKQLQLGQQYVLSAQKVYEIYQSVPQYFVPYYAAQYFFQQVQEAHQYFQIAYQYIQQQQVKGTWPQSYQYLFQQVQYAYQAAHSVYQAPHKSQFDQSYSKVNYYQATKQIQLYLRNSLQYVQGQVNFPQDVLQKLTQSFEIYQQIENLFQEGILPQPMVQYFWQYIQQSNQYLFTVYEIAQQQQGLQYVAQQLQYALQVIKHIQYSYGFEHQYGQEFIGQYHQYEQNYPTPTYKQDSTWFQKYFNKNTYPTNYNQEEFPVSHYTQNYGQTYPVISKQDLTSFQQYLNKNTYPSNYKSQEQYQTLPYHQYYGQSYPSTKKDLDQPQSYQSQDLIKNAYYPSNYKYQGQYQALPFAQYYEQNYPIYKRDLEQTQQFWNKDYYPTNYKFQGQYDSVPQYSQFYKEHYPTNKQDLNQYWTGNYVNKNAYYPTTPKFEEQQYQWSPRTQYGPHNYSNQYDLNNVGYYGPYQTVHHQYQYQTPYYSNQSYKPYQWGLFSQPAVAA